MLARAVEILVTGLLISKIKSVGSFNIDYNGIRIR